LKELPNVNGFRVLTTEAKSIDTFTDEEAQPFHGNILSNQIDRPETVFCMSRFVLESIDGANSCYFAEECEAGSYSDLAYIHMKAFVFNGRQVELTKKLNGEL
jgi:hypothetical protein